MPKKNSINDDSRESLVAHWHLQGVESQMEEIDITRQCLLSILTKEKTW